MRRTRASRALVLTVLMTVLAMIGLASPADATSSWAYFSASGGSQANLVGSLVTSDLTGRSTLADSAWPRSTGNAVASANVPNILSLGAITTKQDAAPFLDGVKVTSSAKIAGVNLLNGAITADAIETTEWAAASSLGLARGGSSKLVNLVVGGHAISASTAPNTTITIAGLAEVTINKQVHFQDGHAIFTKGIALQVKLLTDVDGGKIGSTISITPATVAIVSSDGAYAAPVGGFAYSAAAGVRAGDTTVKAGPTAMLQIPSYGTAGKTYTNSTATVDSPDLIHAAAMITKVNATTVPGYAEVTDSAETANINVLNGVITADAVRVQSHVERAGTVHQEQQSTQLINLRIGGKSMPVDAAPNTQINVAGLGLVILNQQVTQAGYSLVVGVRVIVGTKGLGIPVGAEIQLSVASTWIGG
jgi:hypothetical protein